MPSNKGISFFFAEEWRLARTLHLSSAGRGAGGWKMARSAVLRQGITLAILIFATLFAVHAQSDSVYRLDAGTRMRLVLDAEVNSAVASPDDTFLASLVGPVVVRDTVVLPSGSLVEGRVIAVSGSGANGRNGRLDLVFESIRIGPATRSIDASLTRPLGKRPSRLFRLLAITGGTAIGALIGSTRDGRGALIGAGIGGGIGTVAAVAKKGKNVRIRKGEEFEIVLNREVTLPVLAY